jgi:flagellar biosynthetic protein FliR
VPALATLLGGPGAFALYWLVLARVGGVFAVAPVVSSANVPAPFRAALSVLIALAVLPAAKATSPSVPVRLWPYVGLLVHEAAVGLVIGFVASVVFTTAEMAGGFLDVQVGFSFGALVDPLYGQTTTVLANFFNVLATLLFVIAGGVELLVLAVAGSYAHIPVGAPVVFAAGAAQAVAALAWATRTALQVALPALALGLVLNLVLGLVGRAVPQLNLLASTLPLQVVGALFALLLALPVTAAIFGGLAGDTAAWIRGLLP